MLSSARLLFAVPIMLFTGAPSVDGRQQTGQREKCEPPARQNDGWETSRPSNVGMDSERLCAVNAKVRSGDLPNIHSILVVRHGKLVFEQYFRGKDERWGESLGIVDFKATTLHDVRSISKTVTSLLFGIAVSEGKIAGVDGRVVDYFPEYAQRLQPGINAIRLEHLLTMTMGLEWNEDVPYDDSLNTERQLDSVVDPRGFTLTRPIVAAPGERFAYSGGATTLLAAVVEKAAGVPIDRYGRSVLFEPLGISDFDWNKFDNGEPIAHWGLRLTPRALAKVGFLFLSEGKWKNRQIVPAGWITESVRARAQADPGFKYGYQLWLGSTTAGGRKVAWAAAAGNGGQRFFVIPSLDMLVIITAGNYNGPNQQATAMRIVDEHVLAAVKDW